MGVTNTNNFSNGTGKIIFLHGFSSCGKSTIARALQDEIDEPFMHMSIDHLREAGVLPSARIKSGEFKWSAMRASVFDGFHRSLAAYAHAGNNLIVEHILDTDGWLQSLSRLLAPYDVFFVGIHCSLKELVRRERNRGDRQPGSAERDYRSVHVDMRYDLELSSEEPLAVNLEELLKGWRGRQFPTVFDDLMTI